MSADLTSGGLTEHEAAARLAAEGPNRLQTEKLTQPWRLLLQQFASPLIALLLAAVAVSAVLREAADAIAIAAIVVLNALFGFAQELKASRALEALRALTAPQAKVRRDGRVHLLPAEALVRGDRVLLEAGDVVPADGRIVRAQGLSANEAPLTGESLPVAKSVAETAPGTPIGERHGEVFLGTAIVAGTGEVELQATGPRTELGRVAALIATAEDATPPLQLRLARLSRSLLYLCLAIVAVTAVVGLLRHRPLLEVWLGAVSLAVAAIPEGLPAIVTVALAIGVRRMAARNVLVRKLAAVETLGSTTVVCTDKTGTLTEGVMRLREVEGDRLAVLRAAASCCEAELRDGAFAGDPTEVAILDAARADGIDVAALERENARVTVVPFDPQRRRMSILRADGVLYVKGAFEELARRARGEGAGWLARMEAMTGRGLRVLAVAVGQGAEEKDLELVGLVGLADPPRPEAIRAVARARAAGIETVMLTGDHPRTAEAIARELGIVRAGEDVRERVHARVSPEDKLQIVRGWKSRGAVVAMTGDGVNDAPALREAHVGVAMGRSGTQVAREASDLVLTDDNYASLIDGVREGRGIYENIRKAVAYLLIGNVGELTVMLLAGVLGWDVPLLPIQLLWVNLVTDGLPALALVLDPAREELLARPPRHPEEPVLSSRSWTRIIALAAIEAGVVLSAFVTALPRGLDVARGEAFMTIVFAEVLRVFAARSATDTFWRTGPLANLTLIAVAVGSIALQLALCAIPFTQKLFELGHVDARTVLQSLALGLIPVSVMELGKVVKGRRRSA